MTIRPKLCSLVAAVVGLGCASAQEPDAPQKDLPLRGEVFGVDGHTAFLVTPEPALRREPMPWVWYAPTLPRLPAKEEKWMFERFVAAGIAIAGVDVGESYGSPAGRAVYQSLYEELVKERGMSPRPCLLARSRGGLMLYSWAAEHADNVACIAGIYPVCNIASYPGLTRAAGAFGMNEGELRAAERQHSPIYRLASLAAAKVPILHLHGDQDRVVPLEDNSGEVKRRYGALGGTMTLELFEGRGHDMWSGWFQSQKLVDFVVGHARPKTTRGLARPGLAPPAGAVQLVGPDGSKFAPEKPEGAHLWKFADGVLTASPKWDSVVTPEAYHDFRMHLEFATNASDDKNLEARGNSGVYIQKRYEVQILDSHGVAARDYKASYCASLYRIKKPDQLVCRPAGEWQTFDIAFRAARWRDGKKVENARITVFHNGVLVHDDYELPRKTGAGANERPTPGVIKLQGHHNEVLFRNIWIQKLSL